MKNYVGCKIIKAELMTYVDYCLDKYGAVNTNYDADPYTMGYKVLYPAIGEGDKPHISWCPKDIFEKAYREIWPEEVEFIKE